jgi:hypothetical protein
MEHRPLTRGEWREARRLKQRRHRVSGRSVFVIARAAAERARRLGAKPPS